MNTLAKIQAAVKAPKGQFNSFGKYKYRSCEDIVEAIKPVINPLGFYLTLSDEIVNIGERFYIKATATVSNGEEGFSVSAFAREEENKKGMDGAQVTGAASSYARKYALNGLFAIDDTKDADATNDHSTQEVKKPEVDPADKSALKQLVYDSDLTPEEREKAFAAIDLCPDYEMYQKIQHKLESRAAHIDTIPNPSQKDIKNHLKKTVKA